MKQYGISISWGATNVAPIFFNESFEVRIWAKKQFVY